MADVRLSRAASRDFRDIREAGVREHGVAASDRYMAGFERLFTLLQDQPLAGQERPEFRQPIRSLSHRPYRILYHFAGDTVVIDRIIHHARDVRHILPMDQ
ncbi:type II toxin-antitoxin system RelE/ParE family toxin [Sphingomonas floccifaciens]|uniref:Type II toxin-antitoxin system RelE/ParE family toxin n=1 Tax=Sphingomonas floccifaciens TaxID=1844115 RepID=A0ABW4N9P2_9SPHN